MNQERVEAAAEALVDGMREKSIYATAQDALAAADAVMFSDEAVERARRSVDDFTMHEYGHAIPEADRNKLARAVIAALKGGA